MNDLKNSVPLPLQIQSAKVGPLTVIQCEEATNTAECTSQFGYEISSLLGQN